MMGSAVQMDIGPVQLMKNERKMLFVMTSEDEIGN